MPIMRYKLIGTNMMERPSKGEWVRWDAHCAILDEVKAIAEEVKAMSEAGIDETTGDNKRSRK